MKQPTHCLVDSYGDNILIEACGEIPDRKTLGSRLRSLPPIPLNVRDTEMHIRLHQLQSLKSLYIPTEESISVALTIDMMLRQGYALRKPNQAETWQKIYGEPATAHLPCSTPLAAAVFGIGGAGKSSAIERSLRQYEQVVVHNQFPTMAGPLRQVVWLKIDVPSSGKSVDLAEELMLALDRALGTNHFERDLFSSRKKGLEMLRRWRQRATSHFLGVLCLDEIQNFFKLEKKGVRQSRTSAERPELRIVEDEALKFILTLVNTWGIPLIASGTPDGMKAFATRFSASQRLVTAGFHQMKHITDADDPYFNRYLFPYLCKYQWLDEKLPASEKLRSHLLTLSGGVPRIINLLWIFAQRRAMDRSAVKLELADFDDAMNTYLAPLKPAIAALHSNDPNKLFLYEDLLSNDDGPLFE